MGWKLSGNKGLAIRLALFGCTNRPFYRIHVTQRRRARDDTPLEQVGTYDPLPNVHNEKLVAINFDRLQHWMAKGAFPTKPVLKLLGLAGFLPVHPMSYVEAQRLRLKAAEAAGKPPAVDGKAEEQQRQQ